MTLLPPLTDEERREIEQDQRLEAALRKAQEAQQIAQDTIAQLSRELGFPIARGVRLEEPYRDRRD